MCRAGNCSATSRRRFAALAAIFGLARLIGGGRSAHAAAPVRTLRLRSLHTGERLSAVYRRNGRLVAGNLARIDRILRDHRTGEVLPIALALLDLVHELARTLSYDRPIAVISGYRSPATNAMLAARGRGVARNSYHIRGMALDIRMPGVALAELRDAALSLRRGGVGYYPDSDFVHVDIGPVRSW